jgi:hypothetical protein
MRRNIRKSIEALHPLNQRYKTLSSILKLLPEVKPNLLKQYLKEIAYGELIKLSPSEKLIKKNISEIFIETTDGSYYENNIVVISPQGAQIIADAYLAGNFDSFMKSKKQTNPDITNILKYVASDKEIQETYNNYISELCEEEERFQNLIRHPNKVKEEEFTASLLNAIFINKYGYKQGVDTMLIGGIEVTKEVQSFRSNSRKSTDYSVTVSWTGSNGKYNELPIRNSSYEFNRSNDEKRNWGLPE